MSLSEMLFLMLPSHHRQTLICSSLVVDKVLVFVVAIGFSVQSLFLLFFFIFFESIISYIRIAK